MIGKPEQPVCVGRAGVGCGYKAPPSGGTCPDCGGMVIDRKAAEERRRRSALWDPRTGEPAPEHLVLAVQRLSAAALSDEGGLDRIAERVEAHVAAEKHVEAVLGRLFTVGEQRRLHKALEGLGHGEGREDRFEEWTG